MFCVVKYGYSEMICFYVTDLIVCIKTQKAQGYYRRSIKTSKP